MTDEEKKWILEFEAAAKLPLDEHMNNCFVKTYTPVMDDAPFRAFREWWLAKRWKP